MFKAFEISASENLAQYSRLLWQQSLSHRIYTEGETQVVAVANIDEIQKASVLYQQWKSGEVQPEQEDSSSISRYFNPNKSVGNLLQALTRFPVTIILILICCVMAVVAPLNSLSDTVRLFLFPDFAYGTRTINLGFVLENFSFEQFLNMISPMILHAGLLHLSFNMLWLWEFGRRIEAKQASWSMLFLIIILALVSNTAQYLYSGSIYFGGMSGVVYGLFAYIWMWQLFDPVKGLGLPGNLVFFMLFALIILTMLGLDSIADTAHIAGLLCGVLYGAVVSTISRIQRAVVKKAN
ncbi:MAG: rhomboid family intramembrane serine protease [Gammaproteobacteria bacterium]|jgi:GlpG protein|nr:rhomboid family intramembrane serine protease [Gammaproteobacteria bacterium]